MESGNGEGGEPGHPDSERSQVSDMSDPRSIALTPYASQPDVVLSQERDAYYSETLLGESISDLMETFLGSRRTTTLGPELKALASCLYYGLTNCAGKQTLGQEYCDIALVTRPRPEIKTVAQHTFLAPASGGAMWTYSLVRVVVPYLQARMREGWEALSTLRDTAASARAAVLIARARARASAAAAATAPAGSQLTPTPPDDSSSEIYDATASSGPQTRRAPSTSQPSRGAHARSLLSVLGRVASWARRHRPAVVGILDWLLRLHLAGFYFDGRYANLAMRVVGARLEYIRDTDPPRARYAILGVFLAVQLLAEAAGAAGRLAASRVGGSDPDPAVEQKRGDDAEGASSNVVLTRVPALSGDRTPADAVLFPRSRRRCSLCMSPREKTGATPCGHLFCWDCVVGWCQTNPECPLCRQPVTPQSVVCVYQYA